jgi:hypothetical protein
MTTDPNAGGDRRPEGARMADDMDWLVPRTPVRHADRAAAAPAPAPSLPARHRTARVAELRQRALDGYYATESMMDHVARRLLSSGDL